MRVDAIIPSMFHRRLLLLFGSALLLFVILGTQTYRLTVVHGADSREQAERRLVAETWTETIRGRILDRRGRVLAEDEPSFDVLVDYSVVTGEWAYSEAARSARSAHRAEWAELGPEDRRRLIESYLPATEARLEQTWQQLAETLGVSRAAMEERRDGIRRYVQVLATNVWARRLEQYREEYMRDREVYQEVRLTDVNQPVREQKEPHPVARGVDGKTAAAARRLSSSGLPGIKVVESGIRRYPYESVAIDLSREGFPAPLIAEQPGPQSVLVHGVATHLLGWMRKVQAEDHAGRAAYWEQVEQSEQRDRGVYQFGDQVGAAGIESTYEHALRGLRGRRTLRRDTGVESVIPPDFGKQVTLTIDVNLQSRIQALMDPGLGLALVQPWHAAAGKVPDLPIGTPLNGAAVVLEVDTGDILAMVSTPSFTRADLDEQPDWIWNNPLDAPGVNKCVSKPYPPGSIIKPILLASAVSAGRYNLKEPIECHGKLFPDENKERFRCWVYKQYHTTHFAQVGRGLLGDEAIAVSCNVFFYTLGQVMGVDGLKKWYGLFGIGEEFQLGLGQHIEYAGTVGVRADGGPAYLGDAILMGIGQGPVAWTPLHAADAFATLARGGVRVAPRLVRSEGPRHRDLHLDRDAIDMALEGLRLAVAYEDGIGTGRVLNYADGTSEPTFNAPGVTVWGKTGTAEAPDIVVDTDGDGPEAAITLRQGDHSWFVILVGPEGGWPRYAVAVLMEYAGSGGRVSGPIANQIVRALQDEGYL